jgi:hypothetical protein
MDVVDLLIGLPPTTDIKLKHNVMNYVHKIQIVKLLISLDLMVTDHMIVIISTQTMFLLWLLVVELPIKKKDVT